VSETNVRIAAIVQQACIDLFSHYAVSIGPEVVAGRPNKDIALCGVIGFTGTDMRGSLMLACSLEPLQLAHAGGEGSLRDWLAELTNQLLGRVKNRLMTMGAEFHCSTPVVIGGERIAPISSQPLGYLFTVDGGVVSVWFDAILRPGLTLSPVADGAPVGLEGETFLF
jgi:hypothetical protein